MTSIHRPTQSGLPTNFSLKFSDSGCSIMCVDLFGHATCFTWSSHAVRVTGTVASPVSTSGTTGYVVGT